MAATGASVCFVCAPCSACGTNVAVRCVGIEQNGIGKSAKPNNFISLIIVVIKSVFLFEAECFLFAVFQTKQKLGIESKVVVGGGMGVA